MKALLIPVMLLALFSTGCDKKPHMEPRNKRAMEIKEITVYPSDKKVIKYTGFKVQAWNGVVDFYSYPEQVNYRIMAPFIVKDLGRTMPSTEFDIFWCLHITKCY